MAQRRDRLYTSLMLLPVPIIIGWLFAVDPVGTFPDSDITGTQGEISPAVTTGSGRCLVQEVFDAEGRRCH